MHLSLIDPTVKVPLSDLFNCYEIVIFIHFSFPKSTGPQTKVQHIELCDCFIKAKVQHFSNDPYKGFLLRVKCEAQYHSYVCKVKMNLELVI